MCRCLQLCYKQHLENTMSEDNLVPEPKSAYDRFYRRVFKIIDGPASFVRETVVDPIRAKNKNYYYHRRFRRVPEVDQCEVGNEVCLFEANHQFKRDKLVDNEIVAILRQRRLECEHYYQEDAPKLCKKTVDDYLEASTNWFIKYGDLGAPGNVRDAYMKQKHRMVWERRHGPVGTGMQQASS